VQRLVKSPLLDVLRKLSAGLPRGEWLFRKTASWYPDAVNGAVLGARAGHPFLAELLRRTTLVPEAEWPVKYRLGTHVLQDTLKAYAGTDVRILPAATFYPLGPVVSRQYFRERPDPDRACRDILGPDTCTVHWYASVTDLVGFASTHSSDMVNRTVYGRLCAPYTALATPDDSQDANESRRQAQLCSPATALTN
jgi:hypothetical protein